MASSLFAGVAATNASAQAANPQTPQPSIEIYGFGQADAIVDFKRNNPDWYDVNRPARLPSFPGEFGENGHFYLGIVVFLDHNWSSQWSTATGYSLVDIDYSDGQAAAVYKAGQYGIVNLLCTPVTNVMMGGEFQWGQRDNKSNGFTFDDYRLQFSFEYSFSYKAGE